MALLCAAPCKERWPCTLQCPPWNASEGAHSVRHTQGPSLRCPHRGQRQVPLFSSWLCPVQSQPGMALTDVSSCSQSSVLICEASAPTVLSPPWLSPVTSGLALPGPLLLNFQFLMNTQKAESRRQTILKFVQNKTDQMPHENLQSMEVLNGTETLVDIKTDFTGIISCSKYKKKFWTVFQHDCGGLSKTTLIEPPGPFSVKCIVPASTDSLYYAKLHKTLNRTEESSHIQTLGLWRASVTFLSYQQMLC